MDNSNVSKNKQNEYLGVNKIGKNIRKSPLHQPNFVSSGANNSNTARQQSQPQVYNISKSDFRSIVQQLTGSPSRNDPPRPPPSNTPKHPSMRLQRIRPPPLMPVNRPQMPPVVVAQPQRPSQVHFDNGYGRPPPQPFGQPSPRGMVPQQFGQPSPRGMVPQQFGQPSPRGVATWGAPALSPISAYMQQLQSCIGKDGSTPRQQMPGHGQAQHPVQPQYGQGQPDRPMHPQAQHPHSMPPQVEPPRPMHPQAQPQHPMHPQSHGQAQPQHPVYPQAQPQHPIYPQAQPPRPMYPQDQPPRPMYPQDQPPHPMHPQDQPPRRMHPQDQSQHPMHPQAQPQQPMHPQAQPQQPIYPQPHGQAPPPHPMYPQAQGQFQAESPSSGLLSYPNVPPLPSPGGYSNLLSPTPWSPYPLNSPGSQFPPPLSPSFAFSPFGHSGVWGQGPQPPLSPGMSFPLSPSGFFPLNSPRWRDQ